MPAPIIDHFVERVRLPESLTRLLVRAAIAQRLRRELELREDGVGEFAKMCSAGPTTVETVAANLQHYEVPSRFFELTLGPRLKYSACLWNEEAASLNAAEEAMLRLTCRRPEIVDGMTILELGCGWGSLALWLAERYPNSRIVAVSNSTAQQTFIEQRAPGNVEVVTADVAELVQPAGKFDRVINGRRPAHLRCLLLIVRAQLGTSFFDHRRDRWRSSKDQANAENGHRQRSPTDTKPFDLSAIRALPTPPIEPQTAFASRSRRFDPVSP